MPRRKSIVQPIGSARHSAFKKRKASLFKKALELSTLCHVDVCAVISEGPHDPNPEMWPQGEDAVRVLSRFSAIPDADKRKRMVNRDGFLFQQMEKLQLQLRKVQSENCKLETGILLHEVIHGQSRIADVASIEMIVNLNAVVEMHLGKIGRRMVDLAPPPVPPLMGVNMWAGPSVVLSDPMIGFTADVSLGQGRSTEMEKDWQPGSGYVLGPTGSDFDLAPAVVEAQVEDEIERVIDFSSYGFNEEVTDLLFAQIFIS